MNNPAQQKIKKLLPILLVTLLNLLSFNKAYAQQATGTMSFSGLSTTASGISIHATLTGTDASISHVDAFLKCANGFYYSYDGFKMGLNSGTANDGTWSMGFSQTGISSAIASGFLPADCSSVNVNSTSTWQIDGVSTYCGSGTPQFCNQSWYGGPATTNACWTSYGSSSGCSPPGSMGSDIIIVPPDTTAPSQPTLQPLGYNPDGSITVTANAASDPDSPSGINYFFEYCYYNPSWTCFNTPGSTSLSYTYPAGTFTLGTNYWFMASAKDTAGNWSGWGPSQLIDNYAPSNAQISTFTYNSDGSITVGISQATDPDTPSSNLQYYISVTGPPPDATSCAQYNGYPNGCSGGTTAGCSYYSCNNTCWPTGTSNAAAGCTPVAITNSGWIAATYTYTFAASNFPQHEATYYFSIIARDPRGNQSPNSTTAGYITPQSQATCHLYDGNSTSCNNAPGCAFYACSNLCFPTGTSNTTACPTTVDIKANNSDGPVNLNYDGVTAPSVNLTWASSNATACNATGAWSGPLAVNNTTGVSSGPLTTINGQNTTYTYGISCNSNGGIAGVDNVNVVVQPNAPPPAPVITVTPATVNPGDSVTVSWNANSNLASNCWVPSVGTWGWSNSDINGRTSGTVTKTNITANTTYALYCLNYSPSGTGPNGYGYVSLRNSAGCVNEGIPSLNVGWTADPGAVSYNIYRAAFTDVTYTLIQTNWLSTAYTDQPLTPHNQYKYQIESVHSDGSRSIIYTSSNLQAYYCDYSVPSVNVVSGINNNVCYKPSDWGASKTITAQITDNPNPATAYTSGPSQLSLRVTNTTTSVVYYLSNLSVSANGSYSFSVPAPPSTGYLYKAELLGLDKADNPTPGQTGTPPNSSGWISPVIFDYEDDCSIPWLQVSGGDVHSNGKINLPGGP